MEKKIIIFLSKFFLRKVYRKRRRKFSGHVTKV